MLGCTLPHCWVNGDEYGTQALKMNNGWGIPPIHCSFSFLKCHSRSFGNDAVVQGSSSDKVESAPWVTTCITRVPAGNSKSQIVLPHMLTKWSNKPINGHTSGSCWCFRNYSITCYLGIWLLNKQAEMSLNHPTHWLQTRSCPRKKDKILWSQCTSCSIKTSTKRKKTSRQNEFSWYFTLTWKKASRLANIFWVQNDLREIAGIQDLSRRNVSTPNLHANFPSSRPGEVGKPNSPFKVLHPASSKMFKTRIFAFATRPGCKKTAHFRGGGFSSSSKAQISSKHFKQTNLP